MKEYLVFGLTVVDKNQHIQTRLNNYAKDGWKLISFSRATIVLERDRAKECDPSDWNIKPDNQEGVIG